MASYTSTQSGLWSSTSTWGGSGPPGNGDTVTIASGHTVTFDVDQSGFSTGLAGLTINGTLKFKTDAVTCLKMDSNVNITLNGTLSIGEASDPIQRPAVGSEYRASLILQGTGQISQATNSTFQMVGWTPTRNHTTIAASAAAGSNQIVLTEPLGLQAGDKIVVGTSAATTNGYMESATESSKGVFTVSAVSEDGKTVTLSGTLGYARSPGDYVAWHSRPIDVNIASGVLLKEYNQFYGLYRGFRINKNFGDFGYKPLPLGSPLLSYATFTPGGGYECHVQP